MKPTLILSLLFILLSFFSRSAYAEQLPGLRFSIGPWFHKTLFESSFPRVIDSYKPGFAITAEAASSDSGSIEANIIWMRKNYYRENATSYIIESLPRIYLSLGYRYWLFSRMSVALALGSNYSIGSHKQEESFGSDASNLESSARDTTEYLIDSSLQLLVWKSKVHNLVADFRYAKNFTPRNSESANHFGLMLLYRKNIEFKPRLKE